MDTIIFVGTIIIFSNKVKEYREQELHVTFPTQQGTCLNFVLALRRSGEVKFKVSGIITMLGLHNRQNVNCFFKTSFYKVSFSSAAKVFLLFGGCSCLEFTFIPKQLLFYQCFSLIDLRVKSARSTVTLSFNNPT